MADYPEHEKLKKISDKSQTVGDFLEWLNSQGLHLCEWVDSRYAGEGEFSSANKNTDDLLAEFFEIDQAKLEEEKRELIQEARRRNIKVAENQRDGED
jgi:hypothetical protein